MIRSTLAGGALLMLAACGTPQAPEPMAPAAPAPVAAPAQPKVAAAAPAPVAVPAPADDHGTRLLAPMPGMVIKYVKQVGDAVTKGEPVVVLEAMKMENALVAPCDGVIKSIGFKSGDTVAKGAVLFSVG